MGAPLDAVAMVVTDVFVIQVCLNKVSSSFPSLCCSDLPSPLSAPLDLSRSPTFLPAADHTLRCSTPPRFHRHLVAIYLADPVVAAPVPSHQWLFRRPCPHLGCSDLPLLSALMHCRLRLAVTVVFADAVPDHLRCTCGCSDALAPFEVSASLPSWNALLCSRLLLHFAARLSKQPRILRFQDYLDTHPSGVALKSSFPPRIRLRASSHTVGDVILTNLSVVRYGFLLRLRRPFFNRRKAWSLRQGVSAAGAPTAHRRRAPFCLRWSVFLCCSGLWTYL